MMDEEELNELIHEIAHLRDELIDLKFGDFMQMMGDPFVVIATARKKIQADQKTIAEYKDSQVH